MHVNVTYRNGMNAPRRCFWSGGVSLMAAFLAMVLITLISASCDYVEVPNNVVCPPSIDGLRTVAFAGRCWQVRRSSQPEQSGPNYFSDDRRDVWVDAQNNLHLKISHRDGKWLCTEVFTKGGLGYGTYEFRLSGYVDRMDPNVVLGMFTWNDNASQIGALSEIDIEIARWGHPTRPNLNYSVQPLYGPDDPDGSYRERSKSFDFVLSEPKSTHLFDWRPDRIVFLGYRGYADWYAQFGNWTFTSDNPPRRSPEPQLPNPVVIPAPSATTTVRIDLWLKDVSNGGIGSPPTSGQDVEVVVEDFRFTPSP